MTSRRTSPPTSPEPGASLSRRAAVGMLAGAAVWPLLGGCTLPPPPVDPFADIRRGRLRSRPGARKGVQPHGRIEYIIGDYSSAVIYTPATVDRDVATPLLLYLHGASRNVDGVIDAFKPWLDEAGVIMVAPYAARGGSWDAVQGLGFLEDPLVIDQALGIAYQNWTIHPSKVLCSGFSDGGTYSLAIGRANGDLFCKVVSFSPGMLLEIPEVNGKPPMMITHGTQDDVLAYDTTANIIVPELLERGYTVDFRTFEGPHGILSSAAEEMVLALGAVPHGG